MGRAAVLDSLHNNFTYDTKGPAPALFPAERHGCGGQEYRVLYCANCGNEIRVPVSCGDRTCPDCRQVQFLRLRRRYLPKVAGCEIGRLALVTLTLRLGPDDQELAAKLQRIRRAWSKLVRLAAWRPVDGGLAVIEAKWSSRFAGVWNVHIHALCEVGQVVRPFRYWSAGQGGAGFGGRVWKRQRQRRLGADLLGAGRVLSPQGLSDTWRRLTGDSYIVDIQPVRKLSQGRGGARGAVCYILKYLTKDMGFPSTAARAAYNEAMTIRRVEASGRVIRSGRRIVMTFGTWHSTSKRYRFSRTRPAPAACRECHEVAGWLCAWDLVRMAAAASDHGWTAEERAGPAPPTSKEWRYGSIFAKPC